MAMLPQLIPPFRYAIVEESFYRGAYPTIKNYRFLRRLHLKTIVSMTPEPHPNRDMLEFCEHEGITSRHFYVDKFQDVVTLSNAKVLQILQIIIRPDNLPLYLHCLDGTHVVGLVVMCFRKLQSWNLSTSAAEFCSFQKSGEISREESQFVEAFKGEIEIPPVISNWLWQGVRTVKHPTFRLRLLPSPVNNEQKEEEVASASMHSADHRMFESGSLPTYQGSSLSSSGGLDSNARNRGVNGLAALVNVTGPMSRLTISGQGNSDMARGGVIYGAGEPEERARYRSRSRSKGLPSNAGAGSDEGGIVGAGIVYKSPKMKAADKMGKRRAVAVARFSHDGWGLQYTERKRTLEALALEGLRVVGSGRPAKLPVLPRLDRSVVFRIAVDFVLDDYTSTMSWLSECTIRTGDKEEGG
ncbi:hypothetical protein R1flu_001107 [Riccia fluitans]|uniref:Tyrosine phosphatase n=1 Tax=Riccia fluitans TaxID=41844 RepID=A0ABD1Y596_9MARC